MIRPAFPARSLAVARIAATIALSATMALGSARAQQPSMAPSARRYLDNALATLERESMHRKTVDWKLIRDSAYARAAGASTTDETWSAIQWALRKVDRHSFLITPRRMPMNAADGAGTVVSTGAPSRPPRTPEAAGALLDDAYGYLVVPGFSGGNRPTFVDSLQQHIRMFDKQGACGWIIDLRHNDGGNMWPMLAGIGPLLSTSRPGAFVDAKQTVTLWHYRDGRAWAGPMEPPARADFGGRGDQNAYRLRVADAPVALLLSRVTASSGEAVAVAFLGRPNVRTFGDSTAGFNSSNAPFPLSDGARMVITNASNVDRRGRIYGLTIMPDEFIAWAEGDRRDAPLERAKAWLGEQPPCAARPSSDFPR